VIDFLPFSALPESDRLGIPEWPAEVREAQGEAPPKGWLRMTREDYATYRAKHEAAQDAWVAANTPPPAQPVPAEVTNFQARAALLQLPAPEGSTAPTMLHHIDAFLRERRDNPEFALAWQAWEFANVFVRHGAAVMTLSAIFGLDAMLDDLFRQAALIEA
jgi:hypothetical protein